jgi:threonine/homoserine/homoserine lactone efflux protein
VLVGRGFLFGFSLAASVGPIWLLVARRTLTHGRLVGLASGLGVATADALYGAFAALGFSLVTALLLSFRLWLRLGGGVFLCYLGVATLRARPVEGTERPTGRGLWAAYLSMLALTLANPMTILAFLAIFAGLGLADAGGDAAAALTLVLGVLLGSGLWWVILSTLLGRVRTRLTPGVLRALNLASGLLIGGFGVVAIFGALADLG